MEMNGTHPAHSGAGKKKRRREEGLFPAAARQTRLELAVSSII